MNRRQAILLGLLALLLVGNVIWYFTRDRGLITIHVDGKPLREVIKSIAHQGHVDLRSDLDPETPVGMNVDKVPLIEALETLATTTDSRWHVQYFLAPEKPALQNGLAAFATGTMAGWKTMQFPSFPFGGFDAATPPDPRRETLTLTAPDPPTLQGYLDAASKVSSAGFRVLESWNPPVKTAPAAGEVAHLIPKLAKAAGGVAAEVFVLTKQRGDFPFRGGEQAGGGSPDDFRAIIEKRAEAQISALPPAERAEAQADIQKQRAFFDSLRDLPPEQRMAKFMEQMTDPQNQARMADRMERSDSRRTPKQRVDRYRHFVERKAQMQAGGPPAGGGPDTPPPPPPGRN